MHVQLTILKLMSHLLVLLQLHHTGLHGIYLQTSCHIVILIFLELVHDLIVIRKEFHLITLH